MRFYFNWERLSKIGNLKLLNSTYYFFVLIPIVVNLLKGIENNAKVKAFSDEYGVTIGLPFSWQLLYLSSISFIIGKLIYMYYCPELIKDYKDFSDYLKSGKSKYNLYLMLSPFQFKDKRLNTRSYIYISQNSDTHTELPTHKEYNNIKHYLNKTYVFARMFTALFFILGICLLLVVMIQKMWFTISYIFA